MTAGKRATITAVLGETYPRSAAVVMSKGPSPVCVFSIQQDGATSRTHYYERAIMLLKRAVLLRILAPHLVKTDNMIADLHTKAVEKGAYFR